SSCVVGLRSLSCNRTGQISRARKVAVTRGFNVSFVAHNVAKSLGPADSQYFDHSRKPRSCDRVWAAPHELGQVRRQGPKFTPGQAARAGAMKGCPGGPEHHMAVLLQQLF